MTITAKFSSTCPVCHKGIRIGSKVSWARGSKAMHLSCANPNLQHRADTTPEPWQAQAHTYQVRFNYLNGEPDRTVAQLAINENAALRMVETMYNAEGICYAPVHDRALCPTCHEGATWYKEWSNAD